MIPQKGPSGRNPAADRVTMHEWYQGLDSETRERIGLLVRQTAKLAVFGCLVVLDNQSGSYPAQQRVSDYALYLQTYTDAHAQVSNSAQTAVRLNPVHAADDDLHDKFLFILRENQRVDP